MHNVYCKCIIYPNCIQQPRKSNLQIYKVLHGNFKIFLRSRNLCIRSLCTWCGPIFKDYDIAVEYVIEGILE